ncbi:hypothetical protein H9P43_002029 [Blastocladiella emersonii ATCC 22665]|nr:hypothetical protein H9P43_002029 [Blastocladiella emersonii ATCC 22665]
MPVADLRDAQAALVYWQGRELWGTRVEAHFMIPSEPVQSRTPYRNARGDASLRIELHRRNGPPVENPQELDELWTLNANRFTASQALHLSQFKDYEVYAEPAWDQSSLRENDGDRDPILPEAPSASNVAPLTPAVGPGYVVVPMAALFQPQFAALASPQPTVASLADNPMLLLSSMLGQGQVTPAPTKKPWTRTKASAKKTSAKSSE